MKPTVLAVLCVSILWGCQKPTQEPQAVNTPPAASPGGGGGDIITPDVGPITPATGVSLDSAAGGGVNSAAMKKAKGLSAEGIGSVQSNPHADDGG